MSAAPVAAAAAAQGFAWSSLVMPLTAGLVAFLLMKIVMVMIKMHRLETSLASTPKVPSRYPLSHVVDLIRGVPWDVMENWGRQLGSVVRFHFFGETYIIVNDPKVLEHILSTNLRNYQKDPSTYHVFLPVLGTGLVTSEGPLWKRQRNLIGPVFRVDILQETATISIAAANRLLNKLEPFRGTQKRVQLGEEFRHLTLQVIGKSILSMEPDECDAVFPDLYLPIVEECNKRVWYPWRALYPTPGNLHYHSAIRQLNAFISDRIVKRHELLKTKKIEPRDILDRIIINVDESAWGPAAIKQLRDEVKTFLLAGHETSSMMLTWAMYELSKNPHYLARVQAEARQVFGEDGKKQPNFEDISKLEFSYNVLREALRLYSVVPVVTREVVADDTCGSYNFPAGAKVVIHMSGVHHRPDVWEKPWEFMPERFEKKFDGWAFLPFINGPRNCLGQHFALLESKIVLAMLSLRLKLTPAPEEKGEKHPFILPRPPITGMLMLVS